jgi:spermidine synthase
VPLSFFGFEVNRRFLVSCFTFSGISGLLYEVVWTRKLSLILGSTAIAVSICLAAYLGGMALGSSLLGRRCDRWRYPAAAYGAMELGIGLYGLVSLALLSLLDPLQAQILGRIPYPYAGLLEFAAVAILLLPPTFLMGGTLPTLLRASAASRAETIGAEVGRLYSANTLGGVAGAAIAGFGLLPAFGLRTSVWIAAAINLLLSVLVIWRLRSEVAPLAAPQAEGSVPQALERAPAVPAVVMFVSGFCALLYEVIWTRSLEPILGSSTWSFTIMLTMFLAGLAAGVAIAGRILRRSPPIFSAGILLATVQFLAGMSVVGGLFLLNVLPGWFFKIYQGVGGRPALFFLGQAALCGAMFFVPAMFLGSAFPFAVTAASRGSGATPAGLVGRLYAFNTLGNIAGSFLALLLIPWIGLRGSFMLGACLNMAMAVLGTAFASEFTAVKRFTIAAVTAVAAFAVVWTTPPWNFASMVNGIYYVAPAVAEYGFDVYQRRLAELQVLYYREGYGATVAVSARDERRQIMIDGRSEAGTTSATQVALGHVPFALNREFHRAFVIGFGSGGTAGCVGTHPIDSVDVADLEPAVIQAAPFFRDLNHDVISNPKVHTHAADGRSLLAASPEKSYDLILSQPSLPWAPGAAKVFTRDFYEIARRRLQPGGVYGQWFQLYNLDESGIQSMMRTFASVFPEALVMVVGRNSGEVMMFGSDQPIRLDWQHLDRIYDFPVAASDMARIRVPTRGALAGRILFGTSEMARIGAGARLNTDDNGYLEFSSLSSVYRDAKNEMLDMLLAQSVDPWLYVQGRPENEDALNLAQIQMADACLHFSDYRRGFDLINTALRQKNTFEGNLVAGDLLYKANRTADAAEYWKRCLEFGAHRNLILPRLVAHYSRLWPKQRPPEYSDWIVESPVRGSNPLAGLYLSDGTTGVTGSLP